MKRIALFVALVAVGQADAGWFGKKNKVEGGCATCGDAAPAQSAAPFQNLTVPKAAFEANDSGYGWSPHAVKWFRKPQSPAPAAMGGGLAPPPQGTLVFPNHPFARSPRDFFMVD